MKDYRTGGFKPHIDHAGHLRLRVEFGALADHDWTGISDEPAKVTAWLRKLADDIDSELSPAPEPDLHAHVRELHPRVKERGVPEAELARRHGGDHFQSGSTTHHHGPNAGPHARPEGWRTGGNVTLIDRQAAKLRRSTTEQET